MDSKDTRTRLILCHWLLPVSCLAAAAFCSNRSEIKGTHGFQNKGHLNQTFPSENLFYKWNLYLIFSFGLLEYPIGQMSHFSLLQKKYFHEAVTGVEAGKQWGSKGWCFLQLIGACASMCTRVYSQRELEERTHRNDASSNVTLSAVYFEARRNPKH